MRLLSRAHGFTMMLLLWFLGSGCWRSHSRPDPRSDAGTIVLEDGAVWSPPAPADNCPSDMPRLFIPNERGCVSIRVGEGTEVPYPPPIGDHRIAWRRPIHIVLHPDVQYWEPGSDRESTARLYVRAVGPECPVDNCGVSWSLSAGRGCTDSGGGTSAADVGPFRSPEYIGGPLSLFPDTERYLFIRVNYGIDWLAYGCIGQEPPGYVED